MEAVSLKLPRDLLEAGRQYAQTLGVSRAAHIRRAIESMNHDTRAQFRAERLAAAFKKLRKERMKVNAEFAAIETDPDA